MSIDWSQMKTAEQLAAEKLNQERITRVAELKRKLAETDYVGLSDYDKDQPELKAQRQAWRKEIRELEPLIVLEETEGS